MIMTKTGFAGFSRNTKIQSSSLLYFVSQFATNLPHLVSMLKEFGITNDTTPFFSEALKMKGEIIIPTLLALSACPVFAQYHTGSNPYPNPRPHYVANPDLVRVQERQAELHRQWEEQLERSRVEAERMREQRALEAQQRQERMEAQRRLAEEQLAQIRARQEQMREQQRERLEAARREAQEIMKRRTWHGVPGQH